LLHRTPRRTRFRQEFRPRPRHRAADRGVAWRSHLGRELQGRRRSSLRCTVRRRTPARARTAARVLVHATSVALGDAARPFGGPAGAGVLIMGKSGAGKSDVALRMIALGARLLSDDQTALFAHEGHIYAEAPAAVAGLLEVRGVGIVSV